MSEEEVIRSAVARMNTNVLRLGSEIIETDLTEIPRKLSLISDLNQKIGLRFLSTRWVMRLLDCSAREVDAVRHLRANEFSLDRLAKMSGRLSKRSEG